MAGTKPLVATDLEPRQLKVSLPQKYQKPYKTDDNCGCNDVGTLNPMADCLDKFYPGAQPAFFRRSDFPDDFFFGSATASFQIEGGLDKHCRGHTIWDKFAHEHGLFEPYGPDAVNHVENFEDDVKLMKDIGFDSYRLRTFPKGGENEKSFKNYAQNLKNSNSR